MEVLFLEITILISLAVFLAIVFKSLNQPPILAYLLAGIIIGPIGLFKVGDSQAMLRLMGEFGITLLLFMLGLELRFKDLQSVGKVALLSGVGQIVITGALGFLLTIVLGFSVREAIYLSLALAFSSTIIIVKLLSDKKDLGSLYGKITVGILLVQDFFAIIALVILSGFNNPASSLSIFDLASVLFKVVILFAVVVYLSIHILPRLIDFVSSSPEILFLFSIAWAFGIAALVSSPLIGFSIEIGGFLAGLSLANSTENYQIIARIRPLRDFFVTIFFVLLGMDMVFGGILQVLFPALIISLFVLLLKPVIVMGILGFLGYRKRTAFFSGLSLAQVSEFSLILIFLGQKVGHISNSIVAMMTLVAVITFTLSTYFIIHGNFLYRYIHPYLKVFERKNRHEQTGELGELQDHVILIGASRIGMSILDALEKKDHTFVVVDFNPDIIRDMEEKNVLSLFGDIGDPDIQERAYLDTAKLIISTVPDLKDNLILLDALKKINKKAKVIVFAKTGEEEKILYKEGADYVVVPHFSGGQHVAQIIREDNLGNIKQIKMSSSQFLHS